MRIISSMRGGTSHPARVIGNLFFYGLCAALVVSSALFALSSDPHKSYFGYRFYTVKTPSMAPQPGGPGGGFYAGDMIVVQLTPAQEIRVGDIVTFVPNKNARSFLTHRVVEVLDHLNEDQGIFFVTKGDANSTADPAISSDLVIGKKVASLRYVGNVIPFVQNNFLVCIVFVLSTLGFAASIRSYFEAHPQRMGRPMTANVSRRLNTKHSQVMRQ